MLDFTKYINTLPHTMDEDDRDMFYEIVNLYQGSLEDSLLFTLAVNEVMNDIHIDIVTAFIKNEEKIHNVFVTDVINEFGAHDLPENVMEAIFTYGFKNAKSYEECYYTISEVIHIIELTLEGLISCMTP